MRRVKGQKILLTTVLILAGLGSGRASDLRRNIVRRVDPAYPEVARRMHVGGAIVLLVSIDADGHVSAVTTESGHPMLVHAAEEAVKQWRFAPSAEATTEKISVDFKMPN